MNFMKYINEIREIIQAELKNMKLLRGEWHYGVVESVVSDKRLRVYVDGSTTAQEIPCNPKVTFESGDNVVVHFVNGDPKNKFVPYHSGV